MPRLSPTKIRTIEAIRENGGEAHPEFGGWWRASPDGPRLVIPTDDWRGSDVVGTSTIFALLDRGLLTKIDGLGNRVHPAFRLTAAAAAVELTSARE